MFGVEVQLEDPVHESLALFRRKGENLQVLLLGAFTEALGERIVCHSKPARGKEILAVTVVAKSTRLADQPVNHVPVVDSVLSTPP